MATQAQLAKKLGLSRSTVAAVLNPRSPVKLSEATRRRVLREAARLGYRPHQYAQIMRQGRSGIIGVLQFGGLSQMAAERTWHASEAIQRHGYRVLVHDASWTAGGVPAACGSLGDARVEGVIIVGLNDSATLDDLKALRTQKIPVVTLGGNELPETLHVRGDARDAIFRLTRALIESGRRRVLLLCPNASAYRKTWSWAERKAGFGAAVRGGAGKLVRCYGASPALQGRVAGLATEAGRFDPYADGFASMRAILRDEYLPDAVVCTNDDWALGALYACRKAGVKVPREIAMTGYDDLSVGAYLDVPLTTVSQPNQAMAELALEMLLKMIAGRKVSAAGPLRLPCQLIFRASCGIRRPAGKRDAAPDRPLRKAAEVLS